MKKSIFILLLLTVWMIKGIGQGNINQTFFDKADAFFKKNILEGKVYYSTLKNDEALQQLINEIENANLTDLDAKTIQAFYINAYNLLVIDGVVQAYPLQSILSVNGFFDSKKRKVAGQSMTLNQIEKDHLLKIYNDPRFHFVLVCGAKDCPPIPKFAYRPEQLETQLEQQTRLALNDPSFIKVEPTQNIVSLSQIFYWYKNDFGGSKKSALQFINRYRKEVIPNNFTIGFYKYDWSLNEYGGNSAARVPVGNNTTRYVVSSTIPKGGLEIKWFNNLYTQQIGAEAGQLTDRASFFTSSLGFLYGVNDRFNAGFDMRYRRVHNGQLPTSVLNVFSSGNETRQGITNFGPKIRWAPFKSLSNLSVQSAFWIPVGKTLEGNGELPYIDWDGASFLTQLFNDFDIGNDFALFTELDFFLEDIGKLSEGDQNRFSTPVTAIFSYFPTSKTTIYALAGFSPYWQSDFDYFVQAGVGAKYQVSSNFEIELLYTMFTNEFLQQIDGRASTFNIGFRFSR